jgi:hypothetical protein
MISPKLIPAIVTVCFYVFVFWRVVKTNPGNRLIQCGTLTVVVFMLMLLLSRIPNFPAWYLGPLVSVLCILTVLVLIRRAFRALIGRKDEE